MTHERFRKLTRGLISLAERSANEPRPSVQGSALLIFTGYVSLQVISASFTLTSSLLSSTLVCHLTEAAGMKLPVAILAVFASLAVTIEATVYFKEQFQDGGTVLAISCTLVSHELSCVEEVVILTGLNSSVCTVV